MLFSSSAPSIPEHNILLRGLHKFLRYVLLSLKHLARWAAMPFRWWWRTMKTDFKVGISVTVVLVPIVIVGWAKLLNRWMPKPEIIVSPFELSAGTNGIPWTGRTVANFFIDEMEQIISNASEFHGQRFASRHQYKKVPDLPKIPIEKNFDLQIEGLSLKQVMSTWDSLRYDQQRFSGDVILNPDNTLTLRARVASDKQARYWEISELKSKGKIPRTLNGLKQGLRELAVQVFTSLNPETVGRYFLAAAMASQQQVELSDSGKAAIQVFEQWTQREPTRAEPFFYLSYAYMTLHELDESQRAAQEALDHDRTYYLAKGEIAYVLDQEARNKREADRLQALKTAAKEHEEALRMSRRWWQFGKWWELGEWKQFWRIGPPNYWNNLCVESFDIGWLEKARSGSDNGWFEKAKRACDNAALNDPDYSIPSINFGHFYQADAESHMQSEEAEEYLVATEKDDLAAGEKYLGAAEKELAAAKKDLEEAAKAYREALRKQPDNFAGLTGLTEVLLSELWDRRDEARSECEKAIAAFPWAAEPLVELGKVYEAEANSSQALGKESEAEEKHSLAKGRFLRATEVDDKNPTGWRALALAELSDNETANATEDFQKAYRVSGRPEILEKPGEQSTANKYMEDVLKSHPELEQNPLFHFRRGDAYLGAQRFREALREYATAESMNMKQRENDKQVTLLRDRHLFQQHLGDAFFGLGDFKRAAGCYSKAKAAYSRNINFQVHLNFRSRLKETLERAGPNYPTGCTTQLN
jgi:tetratricopeptide (TPR) repeat protein